jgi:hypothetical protein
VEISLPTPAMLVHLLQMRRFWSEHLGVPDVTKLPSYNLAVKHQHKWDEASSGKLAGHRVQ